MTPGPRKMRPLPGKADAEQIEDQTVVTAVTRPASQSKRSRRKRAGCFSGGPLRGDQVVDKEKGTGGNKGQGNGGSGSRPGKTVVHAIQDIPIGMELLKDVNVGEVTQQKPPRNAFSSVKQVEHQFAIQKIDSGKIVVTKMVSKKRPK